MVITKTTTATNKTKKQEVFKIYTPHSLLNPAGFFLFLFFWSKEKYQSKSSLNEQLVLLKLETSPSKRANPFHPMKDEGPFQSRALSTYTTVYQSTQLFC